MGEDHRRNLPPDPQLYVSLSILWSATTGRVCPMHIDSFSLVLLLAIGVLSYLLGYLCAQMEFSDSPDEGKLPAKEAHEE